MSTMVGLVLNHSSNSHGDVPEDADRSQDAPELPHGNKHEGTENSHRTTESTNPSESRSGHGTCACDGAVVEPFLTGAGGRVVGRRKRAVPAGLLSPMEQRPRIRRKRETPSVLLSSPVRTDTTVTRPPLEEDASEVPTGMHQSPDKMSGPLLGMQRNIDALREQCAMQRKRLNTTTSSLHQTRQTLLRLLKRIAATEEAEELDQAAAAVHQIGRCRLVHSQLGKRKGSWQGGYEEEEISKTKERIKEDRLVIERLRKQLVCRGKQGRARAGGSANANVINVASVFGEDAGTGIDEVGDELDEVWEAREICKHRTINLDREEMALREREQRLKVERSLHLKKIQRLEAAQSSNFRNHPLLADPERYQLLNMIGRGGFSEVFRAYDLECNKFCAVKIHELSKDMTDHQKQSYIRRAMREYQIQKTLKHPRVVTLQDCFPISTKAFGTVLELCEGVTLDEYMKRNGPLPEREARGIVIQILSGLKYMNTNGRKIIHYDLKPGNLFFHCGEIKIADFGLAKVVQESFGESIDLTSMGAGTYWYLPPECLAGQDETPKISNKVDVWSTGVIFYELLFGRRPFGHGQSQVSLLQSAMAGLPFAVEIPALPKVSPESKDFNKRLLTINREDRPDVIEAHADPYLRRDRSRPGISASSANPPDKLTGNEKGGHVACSGVG